MKDFLLEIGTEDVPARFLTGVLAELGEKATAFLTEARLKYSAAKTYGTPRRLVLLAEKVAEVQEAQVYEVKGPPCKAAFDASGQPTRAAVGFAKSQGVDVSSLVVRPVGNAEYVFAIKEEPGRQASEVLAELCPRIISSLSFAKPMRWGDKELRFIRPIRWLVALYGDKVVDFTLDGVKSGRESRGHRFLSAGPVKVENPEDYFTKMAANFVMVDPAERRRVIWKEAEKLAALENGFIRKDEELLEEVVNMVEFPTVFCGSFLKEYLDLPEPVLTTPMREHQRYFPVYDAGGRLLPRFIAVHNSAPEHTPTIRAGNENVLRARLTDAAFFYREDLALRLAERVEGLKKVVYQEELGTMYDKTERLTNLVGYLGGVLKVKKEVQAAASRAAFLSKADLLTNMVYEFPELQGVMGKVYALKDGETPAVAEALYEQYLPRFAGDSLPETIPGRLLSIADKVDSLVGCFGIGLIPTGSQDPYALRRQAFGVCHIVLEGRLPLSLSGMISTAYREYGGKLKQDGAAVVGELLGFFQQRLKAIFSERGIASDVTDAVLAVGFDDIYAAWLRAEALQSFKDRPPFIDVYTAYTRAANLSRGVPEREPDPARFADSAEYRLYNAAVALREEISGDLKNRDYLKVLEKLSRLREPVDKFFDTVLVMDQDRTLRENRLALIKLVADLVRRVADLGRIAV